MKLHYLICLLCLLALVACQSKTDTATAAGTSGNETRDASSPLPAAVCYQAIKGQDTFRLQVKIAGDRATGTLAYRFAQKDSSFGNIDGQMHGDTLFAMYTYLSEGSRAQREVAFLLSPTEAVEGHGQLEEKDRIKRFSSHTDIQFTNLMRMKQLSCEGQPFDGLRAGKR